MKQFFRTLAVGVTALAMSVSAAFALTTQQLGTLLRENYPGEIPAGVWQETTVDGMLRALGDGFTTHLTPEGYKALMDGLTQEDPQAPSVTFQMEQGHIGVFTLPSFTAQSGALVEKAVVEHDAAADRWIVDLRGNLGGEIQAAADTMASFTGGGELAYLRDKDGKLYANTSGRTSATIDPVILLVNDRTASAAELFAANVRDSRAGIIIGSRTYGKGVAQSLFDQTNSPEYFPDGDALLLTTHRFYSSQFNSNNILGVLPQIMVEDELAPRVARLLCASAPAGNAANYLRIHLSWRWYVDLAQAKADPEAFQALLEALPPQSEIYQGTASGWQKTTAQAVANQYAKGYQPRRFTDVDASPYRDAINALKTYGILQGKDGESYDPTGTMTRAELCALLAQAMNYPKSEGEPAFADTPAWRWYTPYITTLSSMGIVNGFEDGTFRPDETISHREFMAVLSRIAGYTNHRIHTALQAGPSAEDLATGNYAAYGWATTSAWVLDGWWQADAKSIDPKAATTRGEAAVCLYNTLAGLGILPA